jgi:hypothetical protein
VEEGKRFRENLSTPEREFFLDLVGKEEDVLR